MAKSKPQNPLPPEVTPGLPPEVAPLATPEVVAPGPIIEYIGEGAELVVFTINPNATRYVVNASGQVLEDM